MRGAGDDRERVEVRSLAELTDWLTHHHGQSESIWLVTFKKAAGDAYLAYADVVDAALCHGWIDSVPRRLDATRTMRLLSPRQPGSAWSQVNKARAERLIAEGRMAPPGLAAIERAKADGSWHALDRVETLEEPPDLAAALDDCPAARGAFDRFPRSSRRLILEWIEAARTLQTRRQRITETVDEAAAGRRAHHHRQPMSGA